jgi:hypothetical protein
MDFKLELNNRLSLIQDWLNYNKIGATKEKTKSIACEMFWSLMNNDIDPSDIVAIKAHIDLSPFSIQEGNIWTYLLEYFDRSPLSVDSKKYVAFFRDISELTPCGLNTSPNASCGKFELLYRLLRPNSRQPKKGDIVDDGKIYELKGSETRILDTDLTGVEYKKKCTKIFDGHIVGNTVKTGGLKGSNVYEIEKTQYKHHYQTEFAKNVPLSKQLLREYFKENGWECIDVEIDSMFSSVQSEEDTPDSPAKQMRSATACTVSIQDSPLRLENHSIPERRHNALRICESVGIAQYLWHQDILQKLILQKMFIKYKTKMNFDKIYIFGDGTNIKILGGPEDLDKVKITTDYFRINQTLNVGYYIV